MTMFSGAAAGAGAPMSTSELAVWLRRRIDERDPAAVVRFGDGEARLLVADLGDAASIEAAAHKLAKETGLAFSSAAVLEVKALVAFAYEQADVLGIGFGDDFVDEHKLWMRRLAAIHAERVVAGRRPAALADCLLHQGILEHLPGLLTGRRVSVISCRDVRPVLEADWGLDDVAVYQVPSQHMVRDVDGAYEAALHDVSIWPDFHARLRSRLTVRERGEVFLVGAGLFGKDLCIRVRDRGGIALDLGSALDSIAGKLTRGPHRRVLDLYAAGVSEADIAVRLERLYGVEIDRARVSEVVAAVAGDVAAWRAWNERAREPGPPGTLSR